MPILNILTTPVEGLVGISPQIIYINTSDTVAQVTAAGYLNSSISQGFSYAGGATNVAGTAFNPNLSQMALVVTTDAGAQWFQIMVASATGIITLVADVSPGNVLLPVAVNRIASFTNVAGQIGDVAATITHQGSIQAGSATAQGSFIAFGAANAGVLDKLTVSYVTSVANRGLTITNAAMGQATTITMPDPGVAAANYLLTQNAGTQTIGTGSLTLTLGSITVSAGNIAATLGSITAGTTLTAGTGIVSTTGNIVGTAGTLVSGSAAGGTIGTLTLFSSATPGATLVWTAPNNTGATATTFTTVPFGQATTISMADPVNANARLLIAATATPFTANHSIVASGTGGLIADAGYQLKTVAQAVVAGGAAAQTVVDAFCTSASMVVCTWNDTTNAVTIQKAVAGNGSFVVTSSADPGASHLNYIITKV